MSPFAVQIQTPTKTSQAAAAEAEAKAEQTILRCAVQLWPYPHRYRQPQRSQQQHRHRAHPQPARRTTVWVIQRPLPHRRRRKSTRNGWRMRRHRSRWRMPTKRTNCVAPRPSIVRVNRKCSRQSTSTSIATLTSPAIRRVCWPDPLLRRPACPVIIRTRATFPPRRWPSRWVAAEGFVISNHTADSE